MPAELWSFYIKREFNIDILRPANFIFAFWNGAYFMQETGFIGRPMPMQWNFLFSLLRGDGFGTEAGGSRGTRLCDKFVVFTSRNSNVSMFDQKMSVKLYA